MAQAAAHAQHPVEPPSARGRGRPTADRAAAIDAAIRTAALELFVEAGFAAASMDAIAAAAKVSKGTLYARYQRKEQLFRAVLEAELARWSRRAAARDHLLPKALGPRLRHHAEVLFDVAGWPDYQRVMRLVRASALRFPDLAANWQEIATKRYLRFLARDIAKATGRRDDMTLPAEMFLYTLSGWHHTESAVRTVSKAEVLAFADRLIARIVALIEG